MINYKEQYSILTFKKPIESKNYHKHSNFVLECIGNIISDRIITGNNKIMINTNLKLGLPMENINKIAGPVVEAWAYEVFSDTLASKNNIYKLINVEACERLNMADVVRTIIVWRFFRALVL